MAKFLNETLNGSVVTIDFPQQQFSTTDSFNNFGRNVLGMDELKYARKIKRDKNQKCETKFLQTDKYSYKSYINLKVNAVGNEIEYSFAVLSWFTLENFLKVVSAVADPNLTES